MESGMPCSLAISRGLQYRKPVGCNPGALTTCAYHGLGNLHGGPYPAMTGPATSPTVLENPSVPGQLLARAPGLKASYSSILRARLRHWSIDVWSS
eukprot:1178368-Alexandrium_andersonii.AAC.1